MATYRVIWEVQVDATSPREAAHQALEMQRDPESIALAFTVYDEDDDENSDFDRKTVIDFYHEKEA